MSQIQIKSLRYLILTVLIALPLLLGNIFAQRGSLEFDTDVRTIIITAKDMKFNQTNPTFEVAYGEAVRIVFRNEDAGMKHDLVIEELGLRTPVLQPGQEAIIEFLAQTEGSFVYFCSIHPISMRGTLLVISSPMIAGN